MTGTDEATPKLKFLANLAARPRAPDGSPLQSGSGPSDLDPLDAADYAPGGVLDPLSDYPHPTVPGASSSSSITTTSASRAGATAFSGLYDSYSRLYEPVSSAAYSPTLGPLVSERERECGADPVVRAGGFKADEVFEKAIREAVMGLWEPPKGWQPRTAQVAQQDAVAMQVDVGA